MTPDDHQRERITTWRLAYNGECAQDPEDRARAAECALAEFDKRFPAPAAAFTAADARWRDLAADADAEVAKLRAACGQMREALVRCGKWFGAGRADARHLSIGDAITDALSDHAGKGWIDATGAVEATVQHVGANQGVPECFHISVTVPAEWAGSRVLIVRVAK